MTVVSPSRAMIHNLKTPVSPGAAHCQAAAAAAAAVTPNTGPAQSHIGTELRPLVGGQQNFMAGLQALLVSNQGGGGGGGGGNLVPGLQQLQGGVPGMPAGAPGMTVTFLKPEMKAVVGLHAAAVAVPQPQPEAATSAAAALALALRQSQRRDGSLRVSVQQEAASTVRRQVHSTPLLKARLERPVVGNSPGVFAAPAATEAVNGVANGQERFALGRPPSSASSSNGQAGVSNGPQAASEAVAAQEKKSVAGGDNQKEEDEEEAALNLLQLANQRQIM